MRLQTKFEVLFTNNVRKRGANVCIHYFQGLFMLHESHTKGHMQLHFHTFPLQKRSPDRETNYTPLIGVPELVENDTFRSNLR